MIKKSSNFILSSHRNSFFVHKHIKEVTCPVNKAFTGEKETLQTLSGHLCTQRMCTLHIVTRIDTQSSIQLLQHKKLKSSRSFNYSWDFLLLRVFHSRNSPQWNQKHWVSTFFLLNVSNVYCMKARFHFIHWRLTKHKYFKGKWNDCSQPVDGSILYKDGDTVSSHRDTSTRSPLHLSLFPMMS